MQRLLTQVRFALKATVVFTFVLLACPASAQEQPNVVNPSASAVQEQQLLQQFKRIQGRGTIPDVKSYVIEQPAGRQWQTFHEVYLHWIGGIAIIGIFVLLVTFYLWRGTLHFGARSGRKVLRFTVVERFVHWMTAVCFIALAVSGLNITF
ncbi:MAG: hypothetical protein ACXWJZ_16595, partial [Burkholderiaceae bacterium]